MGSKDFNTFMDTYIDDIRTQKSTSHTSGKKKKKKKENEDVPSNISADSVYVIKKPKTFLMKLLESFTGTDEEDFEEKKKQEKKESVESEREFEQEYDEISHEEEKKGLWSWVCSLFSRDVNESYEDIDDEEKIETETPKEEDVETPKEEVVEEKGSSRPSAWAKFLNFFGIGIEEECEDRVDMSEVQIKPKGESSVEKMIEMKEDLKDIAIIATAAFKKLPKEQFELFKNSADFAKFKKLLEKHNVIKAKEKS